MDNSKYLFLIRENRGAKIISPGTPAKTSLYDESSQFAKSLCLRNLEKSVEILKRAQLILFCSNEKGLYDRPCLKHWKYLKNTPRTS